MGETRLTAEARAAITARCVRACDEVSALAVGPGRETFDRRPGHDWRMSIPIDDADSDRVLLAALEDIPTLLDRLEAAEPVDAAARFGARVLAAHREHMVDVDGGDLQDWAVEAGLLEARTVTERCGDACVCEPGDTCYVLTQAGRAALKGVTS